MRKILLVSIALLLSLCSLVGTASVAFASDHQLPPSPPPPRIFPFPTQPIDVNGDGTTDYLVRVVDNAVATAAVFYDADTLRLAGAEVKVKRTGKVFDAFLPGNPDYYDYFR